MEKFEYKGKDLFIPDSWITGSGPDCDYKHEHMGCEGISCVNCILDRSNINAQHTWQKTFKESEPEYNCEVMAKDTVIGQEYENKITGEICTRIDILDGNYWFYYDRNHIAHQLSTSTILLSSTDPAACTVGELKDWEWFKCWILEGDKKETICRQMPCSSPDSPNVCIWNSEKRGSFYVNANTPCTRVNKPKGDSNED